MTKLNLIEAIEDLRKRVAELEKSIKQKANKEIKAKGIKWK